MIVIANAFEIPPPAMRLWMNPNGKIGNPQYDANTNTITLDIRTMNLLTDEELAVHIAARSELLGKKRIVDHNSAMSARIRAATQAGGLFGTVSLLLALAGTPILCKINDVQMTRREWLGGSLLVSAGMGGIVGGANQHYTDKKIQSVNEAFVKQLEPHLSDLDTLHKQAEEKIAHKNAEINQRAKGASPL